MELCRNYVIERLGAYRQSFFGVRKCTSAEKIIDKIVGEQKIDVDGISGATNSSNVIKKAVENALKRGE